MYERIAKNRELLFAQLQESEVPGNWDHILQDRGMFTMVRGDDGGSLSGDDMVHLRATEHIYMLDSGRISLCGLNENNIKLFVDGIAKVLRRRKEKICARHGKGCTTVIGTLGDLSNCVTSEGTLVALQDTDGSTSASSVDDGDA